MFTIHYKRYNSLDENVYLYLAIQIDFNFFFLKKKLYINPNQNSTKVIRVICDGKFKKYNTKN